MTQENNNDTMSDALYSLQH